MAQWCTLAARAGLAVSPMTMGTGAAAAEPAPVPSATCVVFDRTTFGTPLPKSVATACVRLADAVGTRLLSVTLAKAGDAWIFAGASPRGDIRIGSDALLDALTVALGGARS